MSRRPSISASFEATPYEDNASAQDQKPGGAPERLEQINWLEVVRDADDAAIRSRFSGHVAQLLGEVEQHAPNCCWLALMDTEGSIGPYNANRVFASLKRLNPSKEKNVALLLVSRGGQVEPAYQISKLCKQYAKERFLVLIPRYAKSAATLLALGAYEIHFGTLGELGPIDPQLGGLPALGVVQALNTIAEVSERYPKSAEMFARYLMMALTVEQIGYCQRIGESAVQYAERLLSTKAFLPTDKTLIARDLVYEYKDHSFVIDADEARKRLGDEWVKTETLEIRIAETIYSVYEHVDLLLRFIKRKRLLVNGDLEEGVMIFDIE